MSTREIQEKIKARDRVKLEDKEAEEESEYSEVAIDDESEETVEGSTDYISKKSATAPKLTLRAMMSLLQVLNSLKKI